MEKEKNDVENMDDFSKSENNLEGKTWKYKSAGIITGIILSLMIIVYVLLLVIPGVEMQACIGIGIFYGVIAIFEFFLGSIFTIWRHNKKISDKNFSMISKEVSYACILLLFISSAFGIYNYNLSIIEGVTNEDRVGALKPIIYFYPESGENINVKLLASEQITCSYPKYIDGWNVYAEPNGDLYYDNNSSKLYALYYEANNKNAYSVENEGFVVKSEDVADFLDEKLEILGLNYKEREEFIVYWLPNLESNKYNYIRFATLEEIENNMPLSIEPEPDTLIRVMMTYKGLENPINVEEQKLTRVDRNGYTIVEWGGSCIK